MSSAANLTVTRYRICGGGGAAPISGAAHEAYTLLGTESTAGFEITEDLGYCLIVKVENTGDMNWTTDMQLQFDLDGAESWVNVDATSSGIEVLATGDTDAATATTERLTADTETFDTSEVEEVDGLIATNVAGHSTRELYFALQFISAELSGGETVTFRLNSGGAITADNVPSFEVPAHSGLVELPLLGALVIDDTTHVPTIDRTEHQWVDPLLSSPAPTFTGNAPSVLINHIQTPSHAEMRAFDGIGLFFGGITPTISVSTSDNHDIDAGAPDALLFAGAAPSAEISHVAEMGAPDALVTTGSISTLDYSWVVYPGTDNLVISGITPVSSIHIDMPTGSISFTGETAEIGRHIDVGAPDALQFSSDVVTLAFSFVVIPGTDNLLLSGKQPVASIHIDMPTGSLALSADAPTPQETHDSLVPVGSLLFSGIAPTAAIDVSIPVPGVRTNEVLQSEDLATTWSADGVTIDADVGTLPNGSATMDRLNVVAGDNEHRVFQQVTTPALQYVSLSCFAKADGKDYVILNWLGAANDWITCVYDLTNGTVSQESEGATSGQITSSGIVDCGGGIYRLMMTGIVATANPFFVIAASNVATPSLNTSGNKVYTAVGGEDLIVGGAQLTYTEITPDIEPYFPSGASRGSGPLLILEGKPPTLATDDPTALGAPDALVFASDALTLDQSAHHWVDPTLGSLSFTGYIPTLSIDGGSATIPVGVGSLSFDGRGATGGPKVTGEHHKKSGWGVGLALQGQAPSITVTSGVESDPATGSISFSSAAVTLDHTANHFIDAGTGSLVFSGIAPTTAGDATVLPTTASLVLSGAVPVLGTTTSPTASSVLFSGQQPTILVSLDEFPGTVALSITGYIPTAVIQATSPVRQPSLGSLNFAGSTPGVNVANAGRSVTNPDAETDVASNFEACDYSGFRVMPGSLKMTWNKHAVRRKSWESRHPQDVPIRSNGDKQTGPQRPEQTDRQIGVDINEITPDDL